MNLLPRLPFAFGRRASARIALCVGAFGCVVLTSGAASAQVKTWHRVGTVTTQTPGQICYTNGTDIVCDSNAPTLSGTSVGIGSTLPVVSLDDSQNADAIALPGGSNAQRPTGAALVNGEIRYNNTGSGTVEAYYNGAWNSLVTSATAGTSTPAAGSTGYVQFNSGGDLAASSSFFWDNTNNRLGIGTASPNSSLTINYDTAYSGGLLSGTGNAIMINSVATPTKRLNVGIVGAYNFAYIDSINYSVNNKQVPLALEPSGGSVGIGTTSPQANLDVTTTGNTTVNITAPYGSHYTDSLNFALTGGYGAVAGISYSDITTNMNLWASNAGSYMTFGPGNGEKMRITNTGNVGIGTVAPGSALQVNGGAAIGYSTSTAAPSNGALVNGQLGVGTTNPTSDVKADINGAAQIAGTGSEVCATMADVGKMRFNPSKNYFEICSP